MNLVVLTPEKEVYSGAIKSVKVPGTSGQFEVLKGHAAIVAALGQGSVRILTENGEKKVISIEKGFIEVLRDEVALLVQGVSE